MYIYALVYGFSFSLLKALAKIKENLLVLLSAFQSDKEKKQRKYNKKLSKEDWECYLHKVQ